MFKKSSLIVSILLALTSANAAAAHKWASATGGKDNSDDADSFVIKTYRYLGTDGGSRVAQVILAPNQPITGTNCAASNNATDSNRFAYWQAETVTRHHILMDQLATAFAMGLKIKIQYDNAQCAASGLGAWLTGIEMVPEN